MPAPWERWVHASNFGEIWFFEPKAGELWRGTFGARALTSSLPPSFGPGFRDEGPDGTPERYSKRRKELTLYGPYPLAAIRIKRFKRRAYRSKRFALPPGPAARFVLAKDP